MFAEVIDADCEATSTTAALTVLILTELEFAEHHPIEIAHICGHESITVKSAYVGHTSFCVPSQKRSAIRQGKFQNIWNRYDQVQLSFDTKKGEINKNIIFVKLDGMINGSVLNLLNPRCRKVRVM